MVNVLDGGILLVALAVFGVGFERYRRRFVTAELAIGTVVAVGIASVAATPELFAVVGRLLGVDDRPLVVSLVGNLVLLALLEYYIGLTHGLSEDLAELSRSMSLEAAPRTDGGIECIDVVIPAYNEATTIRSVVRELPTELHGYDVQPIVVSDGSVDNTAERARHTDATVVEHPTNQGQGAALQTGFEVALRDEAAIVVTMDGDGQHAVGDLEAVVAPIVADEADFVLGSRFTGADRSDNGPVRRAGIWFFTALLNFLTRSEVTDCTNGFRAIRGSMIDRLSLTEERFSAPELIIEARKKGLRITEVPVTIQARSAGETKKPQVLFAVGLFRTILATWIR
jgi:hypothetical protein